MGSARPGGAIVIGGGSAIDMAFDAAPITTGQVIRMHSGVTIR